MENELKELLRERADGFELHPEPPAGLVRRVRRRRLVNGVLAGAVAFALVAGASIGILEVIQAGRGLQPAESPELPGPTGTPSPQPTSEPKPSPTPAEPVASPRSGGFPPTLVAFQRLNDPDPVGRLVVVDAAGGRVVRVLLDRVSTAEGGIHAPDLSADGRTLYYAEGTSACTDDVLRLNLNRGKEERLATRFAREPALSPNGRLLAYIYGDPCIGEEQYVVVRDLAGGHESRWAYRVDRSSGTDPMSVRRLAWLADSRTLAYDLGNEEASSIYVLDTNDEGFELGAGRRLGPEDSSLELIGLHAEGVAAVRHCFASSEAGCPLDPEIVALDPDTGGIVATLLRPAPDAYAFDLDPSGRHLLYITEDGLYRWSGGEPVRIGDGYFAATW